MLELVGHLAYDPESPNRIYFSVGSAVTAIALVLAFSQMMGPIRRFRVRTGILPAWLAYGLFVVGIGLVFVAAVLPFVPGEALVPWRYPVLWEIGGGLLIVLAALSFLSSVNMRAKFNRFNYKRFLEGCTSIISTGREDSCRELAVEIRGSIGRVVEACKKFDRFKAYRAREEGTKYEVTEYTRYAFTLMDVWSDAMFCRIVVCHAPGTGVELFEQIRQQRLYESGGYSLVNQMVRQAFLNRDSILYREEDFYGLGHFKNFTYSVFGNYELIESYFRPLQAWSYWEDEDSESWKVEKYAKVVNMATEGNITSGWRRGHPSGLWCGFERLGSIASHEAIRLDKVGGDEICESVHFESLKKIAWGLEEVVRTLKEHEKEIPDEEFKEEDYRALNDFSVYGVVADGIYRFFEALATARWKDEAVRMVAVSLWMGVYPVSKSMESKANVELQRRLNIQLFKKVRENLENLWYPAVTRLLINLESFDKTGPDVEGCGRTLFKNKFYAILKEFYEKAVEQDPEKAKDMIPENVRYDEDKGQLIKKHTFGSISILDLR